MSETQTLTLSDFLLARIARDADRAGDLHDVSNCRATLPEPLPCNCGYPARVLAECEAKRRIVELYQGYRNADSSWLGTSPASFRAQGLDGALRLMAEVYADHPDYRQEWRP